MVDPTQANINRSKDQMDDLRRISLDPTSMSLDRSLLVQIACVIL